MALADDVANLKTARAGYLAALAADSVDPQPSYSVGGQSVSRTEYRKNLLEQVAEIGKLLRQLEPVEIISQAI